MTLWIIEGSVGFTDVGLLRISESVKAYAYLILSSQASARSGIVGNTVSALTAQSAFLINFEDIVNRRVDIREDIKDIKTLSVMHLVRSTTVWGKIFICFLVLRQVLSGTIIKFLYPMVNLVLGKIIKLT